MVAGLVDLLEVLLLTIGEDIAGPSEDHIREALDGVHRGTELVGHRREEGGLALGLELDLADVEVAGVAQGDGGRERLEVPQVLVGKTVPIRRYDSQPPVSGSGHFDDGTVLTRSSPGLTFYEAFDGFFDDAREGSGNIEGFVGDGA